MFVDVYLCRKALVMSDVRLGSRGSNIHLTLSRTEKTLQKTADPEEKPYLDTACM